MKFKIIVFVIFVSLLIGILFAFGKYTCNDYGMYAGSAPRYIEECREKNVFMAGLLKFIGNIGF